MAMLAPLAPLVQPALASGFSYLSSKLGPRLANIAKDLAPKVANLALSTSGRRSAKEWLRNRTSKKGFTNLFTRDLPNVVKFLGTQQAIEGAPPDIIDKISPLLKNLNSAQELIGKFSEHNEDDKIPMTE